MEKFTNVRIRLGINFANKDLRADLPPPNIAISRGYESDLAGHVCKIPQEAQASIEPRKEEESLFEIVRVQKPNIKLALKRNQFKNYLSLEQLRHSESMGEVSKEWHEQSSFVKDKNNYVKRKCLHLKGRKSVHTSQLKSFFSSHKNMPSISSLLKQPLNHKVSENVKKDLNLRQKTIKIAYNNKLNNNYYKYNYSLDVNNPKLKEGNILLSMLIGNNIKPISLPEIKNRRNFIQKFPETYRTLSLLKERGDSKERLKTLLAKLSKRIKDVKV